MSNYPTHELVSSGGILRHNLYPHIVQLREDTPALLTALFVDLGSYIKHYKDSAGIYYTAERRVNSIVVSIKAKAAKRTPYTNFGKSTSALCRALAPLPWTECAACLFDMMTYCWTEAATFEDACIILTNDEQAFDYAVRAAETFLDLESLSRDIDKIPWQSATAALYSAHADKILSDFVAART